MILLGDWAPGTARCEAQLDGGCALLNLEGPILPAKHGLAAAQKAGPSLFSTTAPASDGLVVCSLANNHTMDYGLAGLQATQVALARHEYTGVGAGATPELARRPVIVTDRGVRVAIISCCEAQFGTAGPRQAGVAVLGPWVHEAIRIAAQQADAVIVSVHAGAELSPWPAPFLQDLYRSWIDTGATVIHGHHAHIPQGFEEYRGGLILYGLGNLAVNPDSWQDCADALWSLGADIDLSTHPLEWRLLEFALRGDGRRAQVDSCTPTERDEHAAYLAQANRPLNDRDLLEALWQEVAVRTYRQHYRAWLRFPADDAAHTSGFGGELRGTIRRVLRGKPRRREQPRAASQRDHLLWHHLFGCLTHNDLIATALGVLSEALPDLRNGETNALANELMSWTVPFGDTLLAPVGGPVDG